MSESVSTGIEGLQPGARLCLPGESAMVVLRRAWRESDGRWCLLVMDDEESGEVRIAQFTDAEARGIRSVSEDGSGSPAVVLTGL